MVGENDAASRSRPTSTGSPLAVAAAAPELTRRATEPGLKESLWHVFLRALILGLLSGIGPCTDFYLPALPEITQQLQATSTQTQLSLTAALIGLGRSAVFGPLSDRIGRLKPLALSLLLFIFFGDVRPDPRYQHADCLALYKALPAPAARCCRDPSPAINTGTLQFSPLMTVNGIAPVLSPVLGGYVITAFDWRILLDDGRHRRRAAGDEPGDPAETRPATAAHASRQRPGQPVLKIAAFALLPDPAFMMAGLFSYIGSSSFVMQSEYGMSAMQFSLLFGLNGIGRSSPR